MAASKYEYRVVIDGIVEGGKAFAVKKQALLRQNAMRWRYPDSRISVRRFPKEKGNPAKRIGAALTRFLKRQNPSKMKGVTHVRVKKYKGGGISIFPA